MASDVDMTIFRFLKSDDTFITPSGRTAVQRDDGRFLERVKLSIAHPAVPSGYLEEGGMEAWEYDGIYFIGYQTGSNVWKAAESREQAIEYIEEAKENYQDLSNTVEA